MDESEWLMIQETVDILGRVSRWASERKLRLLACALFRLGLPRPEEVCDDHCYEILRVSELFADGLVTVEELDAARELVRRDEEEWDPALGTFVASAGQYFRTGIPGYLATNPRQTRQFLLEIFGNESSPVAFASEWRTDTAIALAKQMYESREFSAMPILADALQDAGCDSDDILTHCRDTALTHVRGCWVVDRVLEKV